jgi:glycosyltransferase involved in cell wall biosynthesis
MTGVRRRRGDAGRSLRRARPVRLSYVHQFFITPYAVGGTWPYEQARRLADEPWCSVRVVSGADGLVNEHGRRLERDECWRGMWFDSIDVPYHNSMSMRRRLISFVHFAASSVSRLLRTRSDLYFVSSPPLSVTVPVVVHATVTRTPFVLEVRDLWPKAPIELGILTNPLLIRAALAYERLLYRRAAAIVTVAPSLQQHIAEVAQRDDVVVVPNAADLELRDASRSRAEVWTAEAELNGVPPDAIASGDSIVTYVGALSLVQGVAWLPGFAEALFRRAPSVKLVVVGEGSLREQVVRELDERGVLGRNTFVLRPVAKVRVGTLLTASDAALALAPPEGASADAANKFFDYAAAGVPILSTDTGRQQELIRDFGAGMTLSQDSVVAADQIARLLDDPDRLASYRQGSVALGTAFSRDNAYEELHDAVRGVALGLEGRY